MTLRIVHKTLVSYGAYTQKGFCLPNSHGNWKFAQEREKRNIAERQVNSHRNGIKSIRSCAGRIASNKYKQHNLTSFIKILYNRIKPTHEY